MNEDIEMWMQEHGERVGGLQSLGDSKIREQ